MEGVYVTKRKDDWAVVAKGGRRAIRVCDTQKEAIGVARPLARTRGVELRIQGLDGKFRDADSHGRDPRNIRG